MVDHVNQKRLLIVATTSQTFLQIMKSQPNFLSGYFEVGLATCFQSNEELDFFVENYPSIQVFDVPMRRGISPFYDIFSLFHMTSKILKFKPDIIHSYTPKAGLISCVCGFLCRVSIRVHTFTGLIFPYRKGLLLYLLRVIDSLICYLSTDVIAESNGVKRLLSPITSKNISVLGKGNIVGVDLDYFDRNIQYPPVVSGGRSTVYLFVGRINREKGVVELLAAFKRLLNDRDDVYLWVVGGEDAACPDSPHMIEMMLESKNVCYFGQVEDVRPYYSQATYLILPSYREGFPNVVLQALAMGLPCVVTDVPGANEVVSNELGVIVRTRSADSLYDGMTSILSYAKDEGFKDKAFKVIRDSYSEKYVRKCLKEFYLTRLYEKIN